MKRFFLLLTGVMLVVACSVKKNLSERHVRTIVADTLSRQAVEDKRLSVVKNYADSLITAMFQQYSTSRSSHEENQETVAETITTTTDSLGREQRTEQRTTTRTMQRDRQEQTEQIRTTLQREFSEKLALAEYDYRRMLSEAQSHWNDSLNTLRQQMTRRDSQPVFPWFLRTLLLFALGFGTAYYVLKKIRINNK